MWPSKARYTRATKLNSTRSTLLKVDEVDRVALAPYTLATKSTVSATKSSATSFRIHIVADLLPKPATTTCQQRVSTCHRARIRQQSTFNKVDRVEFNSVASLYRALPFTVRLRCDSKGVFIATQLNSTRLNSTSSCRHVHSVNNCHLSMNVVTQLTQFVGHDVVNKNTTVCCSATSSWVELCRYKHPLTSAAQFNACVYGAKRVKPSGRSSSRIAGCGDWVQWRPIICVPADGRCPAASRHGSGSRPRRGDHRNWRQRPTVMNKHSEAAQSLHAIRSVTEDSAQCRLRTTTLCPRNTATQRVW